MLDRALENLVHHSHKLDLIIFSFAKDHADLDSWLQSHIDAGPDASIISSFIDTKRLRIDAEHSVMIINLPPRLELVAQFVGLFPNLQILELQHQPGLVDGHIPPMVQQTLRLHCPQVKKVIINEKDISEVEQSKEG
ncbi:hypothetical protein EST38_g9725 [Candolleomyces aberdarensis]|uniref:Uncharacterized protein n=1 Tax=Candolleomyces aberdarensis TaxID=2316362 RepID=A0A4Q2D989_9AGAR|nr:hypothetical protein EST38_g9725 [Candolleomyces aberdarensis]